jgi:hypothetical protein
MRIKTRPPSSSAAATFKVSPVTGNNATVTSQATGNPSQSYEEALIVHAAIPGSSRKACSMPTANNRANTGQRN